MDYRVYGKTGISVSALGFGGMRFENPQDHEKSVATVLRAFDKGVTYFDTAPGYCQDQSEIIIGKAVLEMKKSGKPFYVSTKSNKAEASELRRDLEQSLKRLNVDTIDFYHCWYLLNLDVWERRKTGGVKKKQKHGWTKPGEAGGQFHGDRSRHFQDDGGDEIKPGLHGHSLLWQAFGIVQTADIGTPWGCPWWFYLTCQILTDKFWRRLNRHWVWRRRLPRQGLRRP